MQDILQKLSAQLDKIARQINRSDLTERLRGGEAAPQNNGISIGVVGLSGSGKSTLLNALLEREVLPTNMQVQGHTTIIIAEDASASVSYVNGEKKKVSPTSVTLAKATTRLDVSAVEIWYPVNWLAMGTRLLEAPSISAQNKDGLTYVLAQASTLIFVIDARQPISQEERSFLYSLPANITRLIVAATRFDQIVGVEKQDAAYQRVLQQITALNLSMPVEVFKVAPQIILTNQYERTLLVAWGQFKQTILAQLPASLNTTPFQPHVVRVSTLQAVAQDLQNALTQSQPSSIPAPPSLNARQKTDLDETHKLLSRVIADQTSDIKQVMQDNFNAFLYQLQDNLKSHPLSTNSLEQQVNIWLDEEQARLETRFQRLYKSILADASSVLKQELDCSPEKLQFRHVQYTAAQEDGLPPSLLGDIPPERRLILLGGVVVAVVLGVWAGPLGWTLLVAGTGIAGITLYIKRGYRQAGSLNMQAFDKLDITLPVEFAQYIGESAECLQKFIDQSFQAALVPVIHTANTPTSPALAELQGIRAELARLSD